MSISSNNTRIAKNTLLLYIRMLLLMGVTLYTSRVILQVLGVVDFGIYNVVGGIVSMFAFINGGMVAATQRYLTFELGNNDEKRLNTVFITSVQIHAVISVIIVILAETIGLWFLFNKMVLPEERMVSAMWVYQCSVVACVVNIMSIPYNADIVANEKMSAFAYISIIEAFLKLAIVYLLSLLTYDKLIVYAILLLLIQLLIRSIYSWYCKTHFLESRYHHSFDWPLIKEMTAFAGWSFWGSLSVTLYTQGLNMMLNVFFGPVVNAARGIAVQVQGAVQQFVGNFQMALNPQITKSYAVGDLDNMHILMFRSARFSFFLLFFLVLPILLETNFILSLWLGVVPDNAIVFTQLMICISLIYTTSNPLVIANQATGQVKKYQMIVGGVLLLILPISYITLRLGAPAYSVFVVHFCIEAIAQFSRMYLLRNSLDLPFKYYLKKVYFPIFLTASLAIICPILVHFQLEEGWLRFLLVGLSCMFSVIISVFLFGLTSNERSFFGQKIYRFLIK